MRGSASSAACSRALALAATMSFSTATVLSLGMYMIIKSPTTSTPRNGSEMRFGQGYAAADDVKQTSAGGSRVIRTWTESEFLEAVTGHPHSLERARDVTLGYRSQATDSVPASERALEPEW